MELNCSPPQDVCATMSKRHDRETNETAALSEYVLFVQARRIACSMWPAEATLLGRIAMHCIRCDPLLQTQCGLSVCTHTSVSHERESCRNGWSDRDAVWDVDSRELKKPCIKWDPDPRKETLSGVAWACQTCPQPAVNILSVIRLGQQRCGLWLPVYCSNMLISGLSINPFAHSSKEINTRVEFHIMYFSSTAVSFRNRRMTVNTRGTCCMHCANMHFCAVTGCLVACEISDWTERVWWSLYLGS